ncbi:hypothetical protein FRC08_018642 [Ceratobasidium sp. 394]|nr:hypothetical protein FRC08_018642 [Ceratobasidium sp. 394]
MVTVTVMVNMATRSTPATLGDGRTFRLPRGYASTQEMARDNHVLIENLRIVMGSKGECLRAKTLNTHIESMERLLNMHLSYLEYQSKDAHRTLSSSASEEMRRNAEATLMELHSVNLFSLDYDLLLAHLESAMRHRGMLRA